MAKTKKPKFSLKSISKLPLLILNKIKALFNSKKTKLSRLKPRYILAGATVLMVLYGVYFFRDFFVLATVNNYPITRLSVIRKLEKVGGKQILDGLVLESLIKQESKKKNIVITDEAVNNYLEDVKKQITSQGNSYEDYLKQSGLKESDLKADLKTDLMLKALLGDKIKVTDEEIKQGYETYKDYYQGKTFDEVKDEIKTLLEQQKASDEQQKYIDTLKANAKIDYFGYAKSN